MAIRMMVQTDALPDVEVVNDFHGHEAGRVRHDSKFCPLHNQYDMSGQLSAGCRPTWESDAGGRCFVMGPLYMQTTYAGRVLSTYERNGRDDSDFYAVVWDDAAEKPMHIQYASTRGWTYPNSAVEDADEATLAKYKAYLEVQAEQLRKEKEAREAAIPYVGKEIRVIGGRKFKHGATGRVAWRGLDQYRQSRYFGHQTANALALGIGNRQYVLRVEFTDGKAGFIRQEFVEVVAAAEA